MRVTAAGSRRRAAARSAAVSPTLDTASRSPPKPSTPPPDAPRPPVRLSHASATGQTRGAVRERDDLSTEKTFRLKLTLKAPQNATDVITIVTFQTPVSVRPGRLAAPVEEALDGPHPRRDPALVRAGGLPGQGRRLLLPGEGGLDPRGQAHLSDLHGPDRMPRVCAGQRRAVRDLGRAVRARAPTPQAARLLTGI